MFEIFVQQEIERPHHVSAFSPFLLLFTRYLSFFFFFFFFGGRISQGLFGT